MGYTYILLLTSGKYYIGSTRNVEKRIEKHQKGGVPSTKAYRPVQLLYYRSYDSYSQARKTEIKLKKMKNKSYIKQFINGLIV